MPTYSSKQMANAFRTVRKNTIQVAEDIPEDKYDFVPAEGVMSVRDMLSHIGFASMLHYDFHRDQHLSTFAGYDFPGLMARMRAEETKPRSKQQIVALLQDDGEKFAQWLESFSESALNETVTDHAGQNPKTRFEMLLGAKEHEMHHRGQLMLVERLLGITPHLTRARQARRPAAAAT